MRFKQLFNVIDIGLYAADPIGEIGDDQYLLHVLACQCMETDNPPIFGVFVDRFRFDGDRMQLLYEAIKLLACRMAQLMRQIQIMFYEILESSSCVSDRRQSPLQCVQRGKSE